MRDCLKKFIFFYGCLLSIGKQLHASNINSSDSLYKPIAFPEAEGFGKYASGGRGGLVVFVTNLLDDGEGSLRKAASLKQPAIIIFKISGTIHLLSPLYISSNKTIAGQTAPGDGICIADYPVVLNGDNIIIRYTRFRLGDRYQNSGKVAGSGNHDALSSSKRKNIIIDHCSFSWSTDECLSVYGGDSTTLQWNIIAEPLNYSYHFEEGDKDFQQHGYGGIWGGKHLTAHHNLFAHCNSRNPRFNGVRTSNDEELVDFTNNVIYNWGSNNVYGGEGGNYNIVNNYYKYGPSTKNSVQFRVVNPTKTDHIPYGKWYVNGNYVDGAPTVTQNNWLGIHMGNNGTEADKIKAVATQAFEVIFTKLETAESAYENVLRTAGASLKRDDVDKKIIKQVNWRTGNLIDVQGGFKHGTPYEVSKTAWPILKQENPLEDTDFDGMPNLWELKNGLNPNNPNDASFNTLHKYYTNIEVYINQLIK